jgi:predicted Ser/Thr protein kinase
MPSNSQPTIANRYVLRRELGRGGMGIVWEAHDTALNRVVAIKQVLLPGHFTDAERTDAHARVRREAQSAARITHPTVITIHDVFEYEHNPWVVMELIEGGSLQDTLARTGTMPPESVADIAESLLQAVRAADAAGVLHRDIKPGNIMMSTDGRVVLTDFGIATMEGGPSITRAGALIGSPEYMPPERLEGGPAEHRGDLWSIGVTLYAAVEGTSPFRRDSITATIAAVISAPLPPMSRAAWLEPVITGLLEHDPNQRLTTDQALELLQHCRNGNDPTARGVPNRRGGFGKRVVVLGTGALAVLAAAAVVAPVALHSDDGDGPAAASSVCGEGTFAAEADLDGDTWTARREGDVVYEGGDMLQAMRAAVDSLDPGRTAQQSVAVRGSGAMPADTSLDLPSHTSLEVCGTIHVTGDPGNGDAAVRIRQARDISVPHLSLTGAPNVAVHVQTSQDVHLGQVDLRLSGGLGVRVDSRDDDSVREARDITIDDVYVSGTSDHGVETYGVDGLTIGTVTAQDTGYSGLMLNDTVNATVGGVYAEGAGTDTGYAALHMANRNGHSDGGYDTNIRVGEVHARGGGRGIFCLSESGGAVIENVDIEGTGNNAVLIENCHNVTIRGGTVAGPGGIRIAARSEFADTSDITFEDLTLIDNELTENPCGVNTVVRDITWQNSQDNTC